MFSNAVTYCQVFFRVLAVVPILLIEKRFSGVLWRHRINLLCAVMCMIFSRDYGKFFVKKFLYVLWNTTKREMFVEYHYTTLALRKRYKSVLLGTDSLKFNIWCADSEKGRMPIFLYWYSAWTKYTLKS